MNGLQPLGQVEHAQGGGVAAVAVGILCHQIGGVPFLLQGCEATLKSQTDWRPFTKRLKTHKWNLSSSQSGSAGGPGSVCA